jgi:hypothetical protein
MPAWRVVLSEKFRNTLETTFVRVEQELEEAAKSASRVSVDRAYPRFAEFKDFANTILDLADGKAGPTGLLEYSGVNENGTPVYTLTTKRWQASFLINDSDNSCTGTSISELSRFRRVVRRMRKPFKKRLK